MDSIPDLDSSDDEEKEKLLSLVKMGYTESEASITIE